MHFPMSASQVLRTSLRKAWQWWCSALNLFSVTPSLLPTSTGPSLMDPVAFHLLQAASGKPPASQTLSHLSKPHPHLRNMFTKSSLKPPEYGELLNFCIFLAQSFIRTLILQGQKLYYSYTSLNSQHLTEPGA